MEYTIVKPRVLPPMGLLLSVIAQVPLAAFVFPWHPTWWEIACGTALVTIGIALNGHADALFRRAEVGVCPFSSTPRLINAGAYQYSRNPMYLGLVFISAGIALLCGTPLNIFAALAYAVWLDTNFIRREEKFLHSLFGSEFEAYTQRTSKWIGISGLRQSRLNRSEISARD